MLITYFKVFFIIINIILLLSCEQKVIDETKEQNLSVINTSKAKNLEKETQIKYWETVFFKTINNKLKKNDLLPLSQKAVSSGNLEIRLWVGFGETQSTEIKGLILKKIEGEWTGLYLPQSPKEKKIYTKEPKSGWLIFWSNLQNYEFMTLPDISESKDNLTTDATCIVVEIKDSEQYRNYMQVQDINLDKYSNLRSSESIKLTQACKMISNELNISLCE